MKSKILSILSYGLIGYTTGAALIQGIPELNALIPQFTTQIAVWTGLPAATLGSIGLSVQNYISKARKSDIQINQGMANAVTDLHNKIMNIATMYEQSKGDIKVFSKEITSMITDVKNEYILMRNDVKELAKLVKIDMESKLSNPLIDEKVKELIEGVLNEV